MKREYSVVVGNIGTVHVGFRKHEALTIAMHYVAQSKSERGRAGGEDVTVFCGGDIVFEYSGSLTEQGL